MIETTAEGVRDSLSAAIARVTETQLALMQSTGPGLRGQHYKQHGCVFAEFEVASDLPEDLRVGLFATPATYTAYIRFSNGGQLDDREPDIHGMAIKLTGVPGQKVLDEEASAATHDFILADNPVFFIRNATDYVRFMEEFAETAPQGKPPVKFIEWLKENRPEDLPALMHFRQQRPDSPLSARYWSQVPYAFGPSNAVICRYSAVPHPDNLAAQIPSTERDSNYLHRAMVDQLTELELPARFDFTVQLCRDADPETINNPTVEWNYPEHRVATITIPAQQFASQEQMGFGENLSYSPWHALPEHRPVGEINEIRRMVYQASSRLRHSSNGKVSAEPSGNEHLNFNLRLSVEELTAHIDDDFKAVVAKLQSTFNFMATQRQRGRATHTYGVVARGEARCIVPSDFPKNETFVLGRTYPILLRHSSPGGRSDDRARDGAAASIKFFEPGKSLNGVGFYDILMNAGRQLFVRNIRDFSTFVHTPDDERINLVQQRIMLEPQLIEAYRIRGSFTDFRYHTWVCFEFLDAASVSRYIRFRLLNHDRGPERGLPKAGFRANGRPSMEPVEGDNRDPEFLRRDFIYKVKYSDVRYILQAQLRESPVPFVENHELFDPSQAWDENWYPWIDVFDIHISDVVEDYDAVTRIEMNPNRSPQCIRIPLATSADHFASLGHARAIVYPGARAARASVPPPQNN